MSDLSIDRSPELMSRSETALLVVDLQDRLLPVQPRREQILESTRILLDGAAMLGVLVVATEQVPEKLGSTVKQISERLPTPIAKASFSAASCGELVSTLREAGIRHVLLAGIETHVCVAQTALDLIAMGFEPKVAVDAVGSRFEQDHKMALRRLEASGIVLTTAEAALFEWCTTAEDPAFRQISTLVKERTL